MTRTTYRADHVGSLLRPPELLQAREDHAAFLEGLDGQATKFVDRRAEQRARHAARVGTDENPDIAS